MPLLTLLAAASSVLAAHDHYAIQFSVDRAKHQIQADVSIRMAPIPGRSDRSFVLGRSYRIRSITVGRHVRFEISNTERPLPHLRQINVHYSSADPKPVIRLRYVGPLNPSGDPPINSVNDKLTELNLDSAWLPFRPDFNERFASDLTIRGLGGDTVVVAQGVIQRRGNVFRIRRQTPDIDLAFVAAPGLRRHQSANFEFYAADPSSKLAGQYVRHGEGAVTMLESIMGPMPGKPARIVMVERARDSGYQRRGYIVVTAKDVASEARLAKFIAHELSHAWLSNANASGPDRWIDEAGAEYLGLRYVETAIGKAQAAEIYAAKMSDAAKGRAVYGGKSDDEWYAKGPLLLRELEGRIGQAKMDRLFGEVARKKIGTTDEFLTALADVASAPDARWFHDKLTH